MKVAGTTVVVTGGGDGIGRELVLGLLARGARVAAVSRSADHLRETADRAGSLADRLSTHVVDVSDRAAVEALPADVVAEHGQVDGLVNCAGIIRPFVPLLDLEYADIERVMAVNFWGPVHTTKAFLPLLVARPRAHLVNVSSMGGFLPVPGQTAYGASKAALRLLTEGLHSELAGTSVSVTVVFPGATRTGIVENSGVRPPDVTGATARRLEKRMTPAPAAARRILDAVERDAYRVTVGKDAAVMDVLARLAPERAARLVRTKMQALLSP
ncbi:SDR family NAD(P)-dependent oxidoreductase [Cellulomonas xylanilytica]|uniref:Short-chain dehydrogenase n=1 Tax=Cellulomonas xylanilytica TaxID=233583 RepID=A0A510V9G3_9CELL|nr:SDR family oxidoreductase [Cellulomonas xylanilytica]GEK23513.1 short-chain dehydrogenase [Cellulomonas xylanilytica]